MSHGRKKDPKRAEEKAEEKKRLKKQRLKRGLLIAAVAVVLVLIAVSCVYLFTYSHADETAANAVSEPPAGITVDNCSENEMIFKPDEANGTGLIFYPGGKVEYTAYAPLMNRLAEAGVTCFLVKMPCNLAIMGIDRAEDIRLAHPEIETWFIGGHSLGGAAASMCLEKSAENYKGLLLLGAYSTVDLTDSGLLVLSIYGSNDLVMNKTKFEECRANLPSNFKEIMIEGGNHAGFGSYGAQKGDGEATMRQSTQQKATADAFLEWAGIK